MLFGPIGFFFFFAAVFQAATGEKNKHTAIFVSPVSSSYTPMGVAHARALAPIVDLSIARSHQLCSSLLGDPGIRRRS